MGAVFALGIRHFSFRAMRWPHTSRSSHITQALSASFPNLSLEESLCPSSTSTGESPLRRASNWRKPTNSTSSSGKMTGTMICDNFEANNKLTAKEHKNVWQYQAGSVVLSCAQCPKIANFRALIQRFGGLQLEMVLQQSPFVLGAGWNAGNVHFSPQDLLLGLNQLPVYLYDLVIHQAREVQEVSLAYADFFRNCLQLMVDLHQREVGFG